MAEVWACRLGPKYFEKLAAQVLGAPDMFVEPDLGVKAKQFSCLLEVGPAIGQLGRMVDDMVPGHLAEPIHCEVFLCDCTRRLVLILS